MGAGDGRIKKLASQRGTEDIPTMIKDLKSAPQTGKEQMAHLLDIVAVQNAKNPGAIVKAGGVKLLVDMLSSGTDGGQLHAASTLATIATSAREHRLAIVKAGAVTPLVALLRTGSNKAQIFAAAAVASISEEPEEKEAVIKAGAIAPLVRLIRADVACDGQVYASDAIANLAYQNANAQGVIAGTGAIPLLLKLLESGKAQISAANALGKLMSPGAEPSNSPPDITPANNETQQAIADGGAIAPLLALLNGMNINGKVHAAAALSNIARGYESTQNQIVQAGGIGTLLELLSSRSAHAQAQGASALAQIARFNRENQDKIAAAGGMVPLVALLMSSNSVEVQEMAALAVTEVCRSNNANKSNAMEHGTISLLIEQMKDGLKSSDAVQAEAAGAIWVLSEDHDDNKVKVEEQHGIAPTVALLASPNLRAQKHAANALASLGHNNIDNQTQITALLVRADRVASSLDLWITLRPTRPSPATSLACSPGVLKCMCIGRTARNRQRPRQVECGAHALAHRAGKPFVAGEGGQGGSHLRSNRTAQGWHRAGQGVRVMVALTVNQRGEPNGTSRPGGHRPFG